MWIYVPWWTILSPGLFLFPKGIAEGLGRCRIQGTLSITWVCCYCSTLHLTRQEMGGKILHFSCSWAVSLLFASLILIKCGENMLRVVELSSPMYSDLKFLVLMLDDCVFMLIYAFFFIILDLFRNCWSESL